ncbi:hypothetical protein QSH08_09365 [Proteus faecis]|uniref:hypothetical protein n=1 Tax=Proteus TaxID=583 RepID=UPI001D16E1EC|nr:MULTISPECIES: hypothetical protein [Proteus]MCR1831753.1 hypothetical protein [Proteus mirabilis]MDL5323421.1 hypothetical protein [Proteus faecis]
MNNLRNILATLSDQAEYQDGLNCLIGFLLTQLQTVERKQLLNALHAEIKTQCEVDAGSPSLWPFLQLEAQLLASQGDPIASPGLPGELARRFPRLPGAPETPVLSVVSDAAERPSKQH